MCWVLDMQCLTTVPVHMMLNLRVLLGYSVVIECLPTMDQILDSTLSAGAGEEALNVKAESQVNRSFKLRVEKFARYRM